uniref:Protein kinase domain-containing protein n=1 Tax=Salix viminalis TaxID=40686 RepID=A0A6N2K259_SALVM
MAAFSPGLNGNGIKDHYQHGDLHRKKILLLIVTCCILAGISLLSLFLCFIYYKKSSQKKKDTRSSDVEKGLSLASFLGKFSALKMTAGKGGFGRVYKAVMEDDSSVAVKKLDCALMMRRENLSVHEETGFIIYELMPNGCLEDLLHGPSRGSSLNWHLRLKIALDTARGLEYLHEFCKPVVIHRDLKSSNILLDANFNAKLSDFGLAVADSSYNKNKLKLSGTVGYVAPEYMLDGELTDKSDVYAFGVVLLELLLGRRPVEKLTPVHCQSLVTWAMPQLTNRSVLPTIVDPVIRDSVDEKYLFQVAAVAVLCIQPEPSYRPLITDVVHSLIPLVPLELGGTLRVPQPTTPGGHRQAEKLFLDGAASA